ncbi:hypothetical protein [Flavobacterium sp. PL002]|uniref:hypothetical protein n=1 Tax=Flavobacterium sp. PL002 TaxID=1897058 RepID=UPI0017889728|nr:hypothetical protein [Flavobacterium sp. PL002]
MKSSCAVLQLAPNYQEYIFYNWYKTDTYTCEVNSFSLKNNFGYRSGYFKKGVQHGKWKSNRYFYNDSLGKKVIKNYIFREEYFKNGLRDSIYKIYNKEGKVIYSTYFKKGNGIEKDFYENGQLYYEIETKDGYFTDTIRLHNDKGKLMEKLLYKNDSLIFKQNMIIDGFPTDNK